MIQIRKKEDRKKPAPKKLNHPEVPKETDSETLFIFDDKFKIDSQPTTEKLSLKKAYYETLFEEKKIAKSDLMEICENDINDVFMKKHHLSQKINLEEPPQIESLSPKIPKKQESTFKKLFLAKKPEKVDEKITKIEIVIRKKNNKKKQNELNNKFPKNQLDQISVSTSDEPKPLQKDLPELILEDSSETLAVEKSEMGELSSSNLPNHQSRN